jgi:feruloyl esterase
MISPVVLMMAGALAADAAPCEKLAALALPATTISSARLVPAGPFVPPVAPGAGAAAPAAPAGGRGGGRGQAQAAAGPMLPEHCRVAVVLAPSADSHIEMEVWLPAERWNGKFQAVGNGGWAGSISYPAMAAALAEGYATASNDTGHKGGNALFAIDHPEKLIDFAYRAVHEMTVQSKSIIASYYGRAPRPRL